MKRNRLYIILGIACAISYGWLFFAAQGNGANFSLCYFRTVFGIPCPTCGGTRAVILLLEGDVLGSFYRNPLGILIAGILAVTPLWLGYDLFFQKQTLLRAFEKFEKTASNKWIAALLLTLITANWIWNFYKPL